MNDMKNRFEARDTSRDKVIEIVEFTASMKK